MAKLRYPIILHTYVKIGIFIWVMVCLASCEKHDGVDYYKSKCEAELNGQYLIDQTRFDWGFGMGKTPDLVMSDYEIEFNSNLSTERGAMPLYYLYIEMYVDKLLAFLTEPQTIKFVDIEGIDEDQNVWDYVRDYKRYCRDNKINFATVSKPLDPKSEIVKDGSFQITSYNKEKHTYKGEFSLQFSEGTLKGEFSIY